MNPTKGFKSLIITIIRIYKEREKRVQRNYRGTKYRWPKHYKCLHDFSFN